MATDFPLAAAGTAGALAASAGGAGVVAGAAGVVTGVGIVVERGRGTDVGRPGVTAATGTGAAAAFGSSLGTS